MATGSLLALLDDTVLVQLQVHQLVAREAVLRVTLVGTTERAHVAVAGRVHLGLVVVVPHLREG